MAHSLPLRRCAEQALGQGATALRVDLSHCSHMDSTFLGTLLTLQRLVAGQGQCAFALVAPSTQCRCVLRQMGVESIFAVVPAEEPAPETWDELPCALDDCQGIQQNVVQAHQELAKVEGPAAESIRAVVRCMARAQEEKRS
jgi:anti-anti-sigma regulatory factor